MEKIRKIIYVIFLFVLIGKTVFTQEDKRIGLVLSGGTARGLAHVGILKVLEEEKQTKTQHKSYPIGSSHKPLDQT